MTVELNPAVPTPRPNKKMRLGDLLIQHGIISQQQLDGALAGQKKSGRKLGRELIDQGIINEDQLAHFLARQLNLPYIDLTQFKLKPEVVQLIPETYSRRYRVVAIEDTPYGLTIGMADPTDIFAYDELVRLLNRPIFLMVVKETDLYQIIDRHYRRSAEMSGLAAELGGGNQSKPADDLAQQIAAGDASEAPVVKFLQSMMDDAVQVNASDVHIEPGEKELRIRLRQDGVLHVQTVTDARVCIPLISRLKLMAGLDISERRLPQDGRFQVIVRGKKVDVRLSTLPVTWGESAVMRLLNQNAGILGLDKIGMPKKMLERFKRLINSPNGTVLVTGPTGSGKTTTLYSALSELNSPEVKILTAEDPVEYKLPGIVQVQINTKVDLTFARVLRTFLRQDPDVILVGEMRDQETVEIGLRAAITGHFVLSSLHTNDAIATAMRLVDMGAEPFLIAAALRGIIAQRLVRRVCDRCAQPYEPTEVEKAMIVSGLGANALKFEYKQGKGCNHCNRSGYHGRVAVYELLEIDDELASILQSGDMLEFGRVARTKPNYQTLRKSALALAAAGRTTLEQVNHVTYGVDD